MLVWFLLKLTRVWYIAGLILVYQYLDVPQRGAHLCRLMREHLYIGGLSIMTKSSITIKVLVKFSNFCQYFQPTDWHLNTGLWLLWSLGDLNKLCLVAKQGRVLLHPSG